MPYKNPQKKKEHNHKYYKGWYAKYGRNRAIDYHEAINEWKKNHPEAMKARVKLRWQIKIGKIIRPKNCSICKREVKISAHHPDYSKPLKVIWLCSSCHKLLHT